MKFGVKKIFKVFSKNILISGVLKTPKIKKLRSSFRVLLKDVLTLMPLRDYSCIFFRKDYKVLFPGIFCLPGISNNFLIGFDLDDFFIFLNLREKYMENFKIHLIKIKNRFYWYHVFSRVLKEKEVKKIRRKNISFLNQSFYISFLKLQFLTNYFKGTLLLLLKKKNEK